MAESIGVYVSDRQLEAIEDRRIFEDPETGETEIRNRSEVARDMIDLGIVASEILDDAGIEDEHDRRATMRQALLDFLEES